MLSKNIYEKHIEKAQLKPGLKYAPPKPICTFKSFDEFWREWGSKQLQKGRTLVVEKKYWGTHFVLQFDGYQTTIYSKSGKVDASEQFSIIEKELQKIGPVILDTVIDESHKVCVLDCIYHNDKDFTDLSLSRRRKHLEKAIGGTSFTTPSQQICTTQKALEKSIDKILYEDLSEVIIKVWNSPFEFEVNSNWVKIDNEIGEYYITCTPYYKHMRLEKKVVRRGNKWCVVHAHPKKPGSATDKAPGTPIKCFTGPNAKQRAIKMHQAILISQAQAAGKFKHFIVKYGTSEGAMRAWDTRGRGRKEEPKKEESHKLLANEVENLKEDASVIEVLHGTSLQAAEKIIQEGIQKQNYHNYGEELMYGDRLQKVFVTRSTSMATFFGRMATLESEHTVYQPTFAIVKARIPKEYFNQNASRDSATDSEFNYVLPEVKKEWIVGFTTFEHNLNTITFYIPISIRAAKKLQLTAEKMQTEPEMSAEIKAPTQMIGQKPQKKIRLKMRIKKPIKKYGTSEGAMRAWDTRGRGRKASEKTPTSAVPKQSVLDIAPYTDKAGNVTILTVDQNKFNEYMNVVQQMDDIATTIEEGSPNKTVLQTQLLKLNEERSKLHEGVVKEAVDRLVKEHPKLPKEAIAEKVRTSIRETADKKITHNRARRLGNI